MEPKEKAAKWLKSNGSILVAVIGLLLIAINNSWLGLAMYGIVIHILCLAYVMGLYDKNFISMEQVRTLAKQHRSKLEKRKGLAILYTLCASSIIILVARDHWYLLVVTLITIVCVTIHVVDGIQKIRKERKLA